MINSNNLVPLNPLMCGFLIQEFKVALNLKMIHLQMRLLNKCMINRLKKESIFKFNSTCLLDKDIKCTKKILKSTNNPQ